jgi:hypothetical protein
LMVAFHYPPMRGSSGLQRTLRFGNYLPDFGWDVRILTVNARAYPEVTHDQLGDISLQVVVRRTFCLDAARHLSIRGRYPRGVALPDRWASWALSAIPAGLLECWRWRPDVIWSTFPIATAQLIGRSLHGLSKVPWVVDLRDSMTEADYPFDATVRSSYRRLESDVVKQAAAIVFTAPSTCRIYKARYPEERHDAWQVIQNGYDEENFTAAERGAGAPILKRPLKLLHSGLMDPYDRDPLPFFDALADLRRTGTVEARDVRVVLRATGHDALYAREIATRGLQDLVVLEKPLPYNDALAEMLQSDALLLFQAPCCNHQIPAKLYEYFRARKPILCITDPSGDTAAEARAAGITQVLPLKDPVLLAAGLRDFFAGRLPMSSLRASEAAIAASSRRGRTAQLAALLDRVAGV